MKNLTPKESARIIASLSKNVTVDERGIDNLARAILEGLKRSAISVNNFSQIQFHPSPNDPKAVDWIFVLDTLNYSFWSKKDTPKWTVSGQTGYFALCAVVKRAIDEGKQIIDPKYYSRITRSEAEHIFRGDNQTTVPLLEERVKSLRDTGKVLLEKYQGTFTTCIEKCSRSAKQLLELVVNDFESYRDEAVYEIDGSRHEVSFYKRAQILIGDIWACYKGEGIGEFKDIDCITMFADYRIPQVLVHFGAMRYSDSLLEKLQSDVELKNGSQDEIEIRGCSIEAVERVRDKVRVLIESNPDLKFSKTDINAILIDHFLWDYRREHADELESIPYHKTRCIYY
ncbi:Queuosine salvage protein [Anthophora plagiata]